MVQKPYNPKRKNRDISQSGLSGMARYSGVAFQMGVIIALFTWGGYEFDKWIGMSFPVFMSLGLLLGIALGMYLIIRVFVGKK